MIFMRLILCCICAAVSAANAQQLTYTTVKTTTPKARESYESARRYMYQGDVPRALRAYDKAIEQDPKLIDAYIYRAGAHFEAENWAKAEADFEQCIALDVRYEPRAYYVCANAEWRQGKFAEAAEHAERFVQIGSPNEKVLQEARRLAENARFAAEAVKKPVPYNPQPVPGAINTPNDEYFPVLTADGQTMIFNRNTSSEDFFISQLNEDGTWSAPQELAGVNTSDNEGAQSLSPDGSWLVFTACNRRDAAAQGSCDLYWSQRKDENWSKPVPFSATINSADWDAQPSISPDGKIIIFASSRPGGLGGIDLWQTERRPGGKWTKPANLGPTVNTPGDDHFPFLHADGQTLYFTSNGRPGMGKNDLYLSRKKADGTWGEAENLGYPINTADEETNLMVALDGKAAYFSAKRPGGKGGIDIYTFSLPETARPQGVTYARALVKDAATGYPLVAKAEFVDLQSGQTFASSFTKSDGSFLVCLPAGKNYALSVSKERYLFHSENFNLSENASFDRPFDLSIALQPIPALEGAAESQAVAEARPVVLRNVFFETGSAALRPESAAELDRLAQLLVENPALRIQINGHTDHMGDERANLLLSENRAKSVQTYLQQKGIPPERLRAKGYGESRPIASNDDAEGRQLNRRTEFIAW